MRIEVPLPKAYRLLNHGPVTLVTSCHQERMNVMAASWAMPVDFDPPKVALVIDAQTLTRELVDASGEFALNIPTLALASTVLALGSASGRTVDKWAHLSKIAAQRIQAPLIDACVAWLECRVLPEREIERRHDLFVAEVVAASADDRVFREGRWVFGEQELHTIHYMAGGRFHATGQAIDADAALTPIGRA
jgi:flavin reductase (DIM6/NTAB) family NADH-FMN oxidoreductase RutF